MFASLQWKTLMVFASFNIACLPLVYFFFPETNGRTLEEINLLFTAESSLVSANENAFADRLAQAGGDLAEAERQLASELDASEDKVVQSEEGVKTQALSLTKT